MASDASGSGSDGNEAASSGSGGADSSAALSPPADGDNGEEGGHSVQGSGGDSASDGNDSDEYDLINSMELTEKGYRRALTSENTIMPRPNRRPTRAEKGSYTDNADLVQEINDIAVRVPEDRPVYDLRTLAPELYEPKSEELEAMLAKGEKKFEEMLSKCGWDEANMEGVGLRPIFNWLVRMRLDTTGMPNPVNRKVVCKVYLRELQEQRGLTDAALQHIALVAGPRYNPKTGLLRISSEVYPKREENRIHIMDLINNLVAEGDRVHPAPGGLDNATPTERKERAFDQYFAALWDELDLEGNVPQAGSEDSSPEGDSKASASDSGPPTGRSDSSARDSDDDVNNTSGSSSREEHPPT